MKASKIDIEELILEIGTEGGSLSIRRFRAPDGKWKFVFIVDEGTMVEFLDKDDQTDLVNKYPPVGTFEKAIQLMNKYPWREMHVVSVHPDYADIIRRERGNYMNAHGPSTSAVAKSITEKLNKRGFDVYCGHGKKGEFVGKIAVSINKELGRIKEISQLDIAVVERNSNKIIALIEIEETTDHPKKLIGDIFAIIMGNSIHPPHKAKAKVGDWTTLIIIGKGAGHDVRNGRILSLVNKTKSAFGTVNSRIGHIIIKSVKADGELENLLMKQIDEAIQRNKK